MCEAVKKRDEFSRIVQRKRCAARGRCRDGSGAKPPGRWPTERITGGCGSIGTLQFGIRWLDALAIGVFAYQPTGSALLVHDADQCCEILPMALFGVFAGAAA